jgi:putative transposase
MARSSRAHLTGGLFHVTSRGNRGAPVFTGDEDARHFFVLFAKVVAKHEWRCHSYCLMPNHFHLLLAMDHPTLSAGMHELNWRYARWFNLRYGYTGHLFQDRFFSANLENEAHALEVARYIPLNPVRAGLCARPDLWPWSSYRPMLRGPAPPFLDKHWLLSQFGPDPGRTRELFERFVLEGLPSNAAASR